MGVALAVGLAGALGSVARYLLDGAVQKRTSGPWPWGTLAVNVIGSFVLGLVVAAATRQGWDPAVAFVLGAGFCGGFTTWSTATWEVIELAQQGPRRTAVAYACVSLAASVGAAALGVAGGRGLL